MNVPRLRFSEFSGEWKSKKIGDIFKITSGTTPLRANIEYFENGTNYWVKTTDLNNGLIIETSEKVTDLALKQTSLKKLPEGTVLVAMYGGFNQIGRTGLLTKSASVNQALSAILPNENLMSPYYLLTFLNYKVNDWKEFAASSRKDPNITKKDVESFKLIFPELPEQQKIAEFLTAVDTKIQQLTKKKQLLERYKKGVMQQIFSQELRFKDEDGLDFPEWEDRKLGEFYNITSSKRVFQSEWTKIGIPFYRTREIIKLIENGFVENELFISNEMYNEYKLKYGIPQKDDLLVTAVGTIGKLYVVKDNETFYFKDGNIIWFKTLGLINSNFVKQLFCSIIIQQQIENNASITTVGTYTIDSANKTSIPFPCEKEQTKIANFLTALDDKIALTENQLNGTKQYKKGLLQQLFV